ncbi:MAG: T9SS type A sorting domain-containing protein, partial [Sphingobacteriales bacterium]
AGKVANLAIRNTAFDGNIYGLTSKAADTVSASNQNGLTSVSITNSTFSGNTTKGAYFEKLDNAVISNNTFTNNGSVATGAGLEVNLKYGAYSNITISRNMLTNNGAAIDTGSAITVKAHNEAPNYNTTPASLTNVMVTNNEISTAPVAIAVGYNVDRLTTRIDSNKIVATTGIVSYKASSGSVTQVHSNSIQATEYVLVNEDTLPNSLNATCNWFGSTDPVFIASRNIGNIRFIPFLLDGTDTDPATSGFQPNTTCVVVPVTLSSFIGFWEGKNAKLKWVTQTESNNRGFEVQRSLDGRDYITIGMVQGYGNSNSVRTYNFEDVQAGSIPGYLHYRLKQIDYDGRFTFSNIVLLKNENHGIFTIYPNPVKGTMFVKLADPSSAAKKYQLFNSVGRMIRTGLVTGDVFSIDAKSLPSGTYLLKLMDTSGKMLALGKALVN